MNRSLVSDRHPLASMLFIIIMVGSGFLLIGPGVGLAVASLAYEGNLLVAIQGTPDETLFVPLMIVQGCASFIGLILIPVLYVLYFEHKPLGPFVRFGESWALVILVLILSGISLQVAISPVVEWNMNFQFPDFLKDFGNWAREREDALFQLTQLLTDFQSNEEFLLGLIVIAFLPGIGEELVFRGLIQNEMKRGTGNPHIAIWVSALLFSAIHMQFFGFIPRMILGAFFGYLYHWSGNLLIPIFAHFFHNGFTLLMLYLYKTGASGLDMESTDAAPLPWILVGVVSTFGLLRFFRKLYNTKPNVES